VGGAITSLIGIAITFLFLRVASDHNEFLELAFAARAMSEGALNSAAPFRFAFLSAFSVPRSEHPRPSDARSPFSKSAMRLRRCGLLPPGKLWSPSTDSVKSPREWVATAHPSGKHVPQTADKPKETEPNTCSTKSSSSAASNP
jgi:hypothetical protein